MASWSAFSFGGWDPLASIGEYKLAQHYNRNAMADQYAFAIKGMKEAPSARVEGLRAAGLNPILAAGNLGSGGVDVNSNLQLQNNQASGGSMDDWLAIRYGKKQRQAEIDLLKSQERRQDADAKASLKQADAAEQNAESNKWRVVTSTELAEAGITAFVKLDGHLKMSKLVRINKVTGECFDALTGREITDMEQVNESSPETRTKRLQELVDQLKKEDDNDQRQVIRRKIQDEIDRRSNERMPKKWQGWHWKDGKLKFPAFGSGMW